MYDSCVTFQAYWSVLQLAYMICREMFKNNKLLLRIWFSQVVVRLPKQKMIN